MTCAVCNHSARWHVWGVDLCPRDYAAWAGDLPGRVGFAREGLSAEEYRTRSQTQVREWLERRTARRTA